MPADESTSTDTNYHVWLPSTRPAVAPPHLFHGYVRTAVTHNFVVQYVHSDEMAC